MKPVHVIRCVAGNPLVLAMTYSVPVAGSITGEPVMPISGEMSQHSPVWSGDTRNTSGRIDETDLPERVAAHPICIKGIYAIVLRRHMTTL